MADEADLAWMRLPPPPRGPGVEVGSPPSQEPRGKVELVVDTVPKVDQRPGKKYEARPSPQEAGWAGGDNPPSELQYRLKEGAPELKVNPEPNGEGRPKLEMESGVDRNPQGHSKPTRTGPQGPARAHEPPSQRKHHPGDGPRWDSTHSEDSKRSRRNDWRKTSEGEIPYSS